MRQQQCVEHAQLGTSSWGGQEAWIDQVWFEVVGGSMGRVHASPSKNKPGHIRGYP
jgi:hypothetical protein